MAVPLLHEERALGVLEVLDRPQEVRFSLRELDLLSMFAAQAAVALELLQRGRRARSILEGDEADLGALARIAEELDGLPEDRRDAGLRVLGELAALLRA
jgi:GAF domain-containing protein